jgi:hypothetical protein
MPQGLSKRPHCAAQNAKTGEFSQVRKGRVSGLRLSGDLQEGRLPALFQALFSICVRLINMQKIPLSILKAEQLPHKSFFRAITMYIV